MYAYAKVNRLRGVLLAILYVRSLRLDHVKECVGEYNRQSRDK
jgi:hypothetical protein